MAKHRTRKRMPRQLELFDNNQITHQVPAGISSILYDPAVSPLQKSVYWYINFKSNWESGRSHALPYQKIADDMNIAKSQVVGAIKDLIKKGWIEKRGKSKKDEPAAQSENMYQVNHYDTREETTPKDASGQPLKCAIPNVVWTKLKEKKIGWRDVVLFYTAKLQSNWSDGTIKATLETLSKLCHFTRKTIKACLENLQNISLLRKVRSFLYELLPLPSKPKRERTIKEAMGRVKIKDGFYYSLNKKWRLQEGTLRLEMKKGYKYWVDAEWYDLKNINRSIYDDFLELKNTALELQENLSDLDSAFSDL